MARVERPYRRLTRSAVGVATYGSLWCASDHLLLVESSGYHETYARILFRDIQALLIVRTENRSTWTLVWSVVAIIPFFRVLFVLLSGGVPTASLVFLALPLAALAWNLKAGPTCRVYVKTAVQVTRLPAVTRIRRARALLAKLETPIQEAQRGLAKVPMASVPPVMAPPSGSAPG